MDIPADAPRSPDGYYWHDGTDWRLIDQPGATAAGAMPAGATATAKFATITIWINVFIADHSVEGLGRHFLGDDRSFDADPGASSRLHASVTLHGLGTANAAMGATDVHCGLTRETDEHGNVIATDTAIPSGGFSDFSAGNTVADPEGGTYSNANEHVATLSLSVHAADPLITGAPTVGADVYITVDPIAGTVALNGALDHWPSFEGYALADGASTVTLFHIDAPLGGDAMLLLGPRDAPVSAVVHVV